MAPFLSSLAFLLAPLATPPEAPEAASGSKPSPPALEHWSTELLDPFATTRFHLAGRATFSDGRRVFGGNSIWSLELSGHVGLTDALSVSALLPIALQKTGADEGLRSSLGNIAIGLGLGTFIPSSESFGLLAGGGLDLYLPTAPSAEGDPTQTAAAVTRALQPQLFVPELFSVRLRGQLGIRYRGLSAQAEVGLVPGATVSGESVAVLLFAASGRVSLRAGEVLEPFIEFGGTTQIAGRGEIAPPFTVTPGLRFHVTDLVDPAVFASFNLVEESLLVFGLDLGGALRPEQGPARRERKEFGDERLEL